jgi:hypothetical protein
MLAQKETAQNPKADWGTWESATAILVFEKNKTTFTSYCFILQT